MFRSLAFLKVIVRLGVDVVEIETFEAPTPHPVRLTLRSQLTHINSSHSGFFYST